MHKLRILREILKNAHVGNEVTAECNEIALRVRELNSEIAIVATCADNGTRSPDLSDEIIAQFNKSKLGVVGGRSST